MAAAQQDAHTTTTRGGDVNEPTTVEKLRGLPWSIASNSSNTVFVQYTFFGSIFVLFLSALGLSKSEMGFILSLIPFFGLIALFVAPAAERFGYKRTWLLFWSMRDLMAIGLLFIPWVVAHYGSSAALTYIAIVIAIFSMLRAVGITAMFPWVREYVPNSVRGKYTATNNMATTTTGFIAVAIGGAVLARVNTSDTDLTGFIMLIGVGILFGLTSVALGSKIPGGAPRRNRSKEESKRELGTAIRDPNLVRFLLASGLITLAIVPLNSFVPLFMRDEVGLVQSQVVWLQTGVLMGTLLSSYMWGWAADRYGSLPVAQYGLMLRSMLPFFWMLLPRGTPTALYFALGIAFLQGVADMGWGIGSARLLYVNIVPNERRRDYMAVYFAWIGVTAGISQLMSGRILEASAGLSGSIWFFSIDPYLPLFLVGITMPLLSFLVLRTISVDKTMGMGEFAGIFLRGNPFMAMSSLVRYYVAKDEETAVRVTEQLGKAKSPLTVEELLAALDDPRFNVRYEAVISVARMSPEPRVTKRLEEMLKGSELALSATAAWALGRIHDPNAIESLRDSLDSNYRSIRAASARALGSLGDEEIAPKLHARLKVESDKGLKMAYASSLGKFQTAEAAPEVLALFDDIENKGAQREIALALARMVGDEASFIGLLRGVSSDANTTLAQAVSAFQKKIDVTSQPEAIEVANQCSEALARGEITEGAALMSQLIETLPTDNCDEAVVQILTMCQARFDSGEEPDLVYLMLVVHTLQTSWRH